MSVTMKSLGIERLSVADRLALVQEIWDSIAADAQQLPLSEAEKQELDRRLAAHQANPDAVVSWETVKADALARLPKCWC